MDDEDEKALRKLRHTNVLGGLILLTIVLTHVPGTNLPVAIAHALITILLVVWCILGWYLQSDKKRFVHSVWMNILSLSAGILLLIFVSLPSIWPNLSIIKNQHDLFSNVAMAGFGVAAFLVYLVNNELHIRLKHDGVWTVAGKVKNEVNISCWLLVLLGTLKLVNSCLFHLLFTEPLLLCILSVVCSLAVIISSMIIYSLTIKENIWKDFNFIFISISFLSLVDIFMGFSPYISQSYSWVLSLVNALNIFFFAASICLVVFIDRNLGGGIYKEEVIRETQSASSKIFSILANSQKSIDLSNTVNNSADDDNTILVLPPVPTEGREGTRTTPRAKFPSHLPEHRS